jgi:hypothetical protein
LLLSTEKGYTFLFQAQKNPQVGRIILNWYTSEDLDLTGHLQAEWNLYRCELINNGVLLQSKSDSLKWSGGNKSGMITVKNIYMATENLKWIYKSGGWQMALWGWNVPLKVKLFIWLLAENKLFPGGIFNAEVIGVRAYVFYVKGAKKPLSIYSWTVLSRWMFG